ncbi:MAG TPA: FAD-linked oxidase C-terminal domain-containing protein, partial [Rhodanobacteraceae bacterium]|nr:FAD-linked oxidase C-terminal domain-containing protein [Rhodanobacteraceae bacterium]
DTVIGLGGTLSGEHGIGLAKRDFMPLAIDAHALALMRRIKAEFDPDGILNPGKLLPP